MEFTIVNSIIESVIKNVIPQRSSSVPVGVSNRHMHLSKKDLELLFGKGYSLTKMKDLKQPGQFAAAETVTIVGPKGSIHNVRILGPARDMTQVEISRTDSFQLGIDAPVRISGNIKGTPGIIIIGPKNTIKIDEGVVIAANHLHLSEEEAKQLGLKNGDFVIAKNTGKSRSVYFNDIIVRCGKGHSMELHLDTDEANAGMINSGDNLEIIY